MTTVEDRLHELRHTVGLPAMPGADEVRQRATRRRRRHRRRGLVALGAVAVAMALLVPAVVTAARSDEADTRAGSEDAGRVGPPATAPLPVSGIPVELFATDVWDGSIVVSDLESGVRATYLDGEHTVDFKTPEHVEADANANASEHVEADASRPRSTSSDIVAAAVTSDGELIAGVMPDALVVFAPGQSLSEQGRELPGTSGWRQFAPTGSGDDLWITTATGDLDLVDLETGEVRQSVRPPSGVYLVGVTGDAALLLYGYNNHGRVLMVSPTGETTPLEPPAGSVDPSGRASFVGADPTRSVWLLDAQAMPPGWTRDGLGQTVLIVGPGGDTTEIPVPTGDDALWTWQGSQTGIGAMRTLSADGTKLLLNVSAHANSTIPTRLVVVDLVAGTARVVFEGGGIGAFWARDDRTAIVIDSAGPDPTVVAVDTETGTATPIDGALSGRDMVIAAG
jgi:hypothetical protein